MSNGPLQSLINGTQAEHISVRDRGFQYGDGCFETVRIVANKAILWTEHLTRLKRACSALNLPVDFELLKSEVSGLLQAQELVDAVLRISISRGQGGRGYTPPTAPECTRVLQLFEFIESSAQGGASVYLCQHRLSSNRQLAGIKHLNRLDQVLASAEIPVGFDEGLCMSQEGFLVEGCKSNMILVLNDELLTPQLDSCGVEGLMLNFLADDFSRKGRAMARKRITLDQLLAADEIFLCNSVFGVWPVVRVGSEEDQAAWSGKIGERGLEAQEAADELYRNAD